MLLFRGGLCTGVVVLLRGWGTRVSIEGGGGRPLWLLRKAMGEVEVVEDGGSSWLSSTSPCHAKQVGKGRYTKEAPGQSPRIQVVDFRVFEDNARFLAWE